MMDGQVSFKIVGQNPVGKRYERCRQMLVGPWDNQPEEYEGYNGFVGWAGVTRLRSGRWLVAFNSGYWHASYPWSPEIEEGIRQKPEFYEMLLSWRKLGMPTIRSPRGGRCHLMHSDDEGLTWSKPEALVDTELTDLHPTIMECDDGTLLCTFCSDFFRNQGDNQPPFCCRPQFMHSSDQGKTWTAPQTPPEGRGGFGNGSIIRCSDGTLLWAMENRGQTGEQITSPGTAIYRSADQGKTFERWSVVPSEHDVYEPGIAELYDGRIVVITRRNGDISFSSDGAKTWTPPLSINVEMFDPHLLALPNGVLACFHGSYTGKGGVWVTLSPDGGHTWHGSSPGVGYSVDPSVYGYCHPMLLPDGTVYLIYQNTGGHTAGDARTMALFGLRVRIYDDATGLDVLPAPGSSEALGRSPSSLSTLETNSGDPELGNLGHHPGIGDYAPRAPLPP